MNVYFYSLAQYCSSFWYLYLLQQHRVLLLGLFQGVAKDNPWPEAIQAGMGVGQQWRRALGSLTKDSSRPRGVWAFWGHRPAKLLGAHRGIQIRNPPCIRWFGPCQSWFGAVGSIKRLKSTIPSRFHYVKSREKLIKEEICYPRVCRVIWNFVLGTICDKMTLNIVSTSSMKYEVLKFDKRRSFTPWKIRMRSLLLLQGLWKAIEISF